MPKKTKSKKGGGKGKKGKRKSAKSGPKRKPDDASIKVMAEANSQMWETRLELAERTKSEYRDNNRRLLTENDSLQMQVHRTEKDTIDVITYLKSQDEYKDEQLEQMQNSLKDMKKTHRLETDRVVNEFQGKLTEVEHELGHKTHQVDVLQGDIKQVKEFKRKRGHMQKELEEIKDAMFTANKEHKDTLQRMEQKFFEERMRLQQEANEKIAELAERAHIEAVSNLDETTRSVYKENVRVSEVLSYHIEEGAKLTRIRARLEEENDKYRQENELNSIMIKEKILQVRDQKEIIKQQQEKVETLEKSLSHIVHEFEVERKSLMERNRVETQSTKIEMAKLQRMLDLKGREMNKVKKLARNILAQRTEMERFFLEALDHVKAEITANRMQYRKAAQIAYQQKMIAAHTGRTDFPKIRTFNKVDNSTNSVFRDLEAAERLIDVTGKVDIAELTWEQKERVLRFLFSRINGAKKKPDGQLTGSSLGTAQDSWLPERPDAEHAENGDTFLTQALIDDSVSDTLPTIDMPSSGLVELGAGSQSVY